MPTLPTPLAFAALELVESMVVVTDRRGMIAYVNPAFTAVTGYTAEEAIGQTPRVLRSGVQDDPFYAQMWSRILAGEAWSGELINRRKDGRLYTDRMTITPYRDPAGEITHFVAVKRDVSSHLAALTAGNPSGIAHTDPAGLLVYANQRLSTLLGQPFDDLLGRGWLQALGASAEVVEGDLRAVAEGGEPVSTVELPDGRSLRVHYAPLVADDGARSGVIASLTDVTRERDALRALAEREGYVRSILESLGMPTVVVDAAGVIRDTNRAWRDAPPPLLGGPDGADVGLDYREVLTGAQEQGNDQAASVLRAVDRVLDGECDLETVDYRIGDEEASWWELRIARLASTEGGAVLTHTDITWRRRLQDQLRAQAMTDHLTGLTNRLGLLRMGDGARRRARRSGRPVTVLFVDLDRFKQVNDQLGHAAGDEVLRVCAGRLQAAVREVDVVARVGGDEFVVVCEDLSEEAVADLVRRIEETVGEPIDVGGTVQVHASVGSVRMAGDGDLAQAIAEADARMYREKRARATTPSA